MGELSEVYARERPHGDKMKLVRVDVSSTYVLYQTKLYFEFTSFPYNRSKSSSQNSTLESFVCLFREGDDSPSNSLIALLVGDGVLSIFRALGAAT